MTLIEAEGEWFAGLPAEAKVLFLATLSHSLTVAGRNSYKPQTEELEKPGQLRKINEIQHRVAACMSQLLVGQCELSFQLSLATWVLQQSDPELGELLAWSWRTTKERVAK